MTTWRRAAGGSRYPVGWSATTRRLDRSWPWQWVAVVAIAMTEVAPPDCWLRAAAPRASAEDHLARTFYVPMHMATSAGRSPWDDECNSAMPGEARQGSPRQRPGVDGPQDRVTMWAGCLIRVCSGRGVAGPRFDKTRPRPDVAFRMARPLGSPSARR